MSEQLPDEQKGKTFTSIVRIHEANCQIDFPTEIEHNFRIAIMKRMAKDLGLAELKGHTITGPGKGINRGGV